MDRVMLREWRGPVPGRGLVTFPEGKVMKASDFDLDALLAAGVPMTPLTAGLQTLLDQADRARPGWVVAACVQLILEP